MSSFKAAHLVRLPAKGHGFVGTMFALRQLRGAAGAVAGARVLSHGHFTGFVWRGVQDGMPCIVQLSREVQAGGRNIGFMTIQINPRAETGATLVEVVMSTAILAIVAGGLMGAFAHSFKVMQLARDNQRATQILVEKVETIRLYSWDQVNSNGFIPSTFSAVYDPQAKPGFQGTVYAGNLTVTNVPYSASYSTNLRQLIVALRWTNAGGLPHFRNLSTVIARDGLQNYVY